MNLDAAVVYDCECLVNCFTLHVQPFVGDWQATFEISEYRDDRQLLLQWFAHWEANQTPMIGFNNEGYDYGLLHFIRENPGATYTDIFEKSQEIIGDHTIFSSVRHADRFAPQVDVYKINHFDNRAKSTSLKALQVNMRSETVLEMPLPWDQPISRENIDRVLIPYNIHDVAETKRFASLIRDAIEFRIGMMDTLGPYCINFNDTKIGAKILEQRLGDELCYSFDTGRREPRQTPRQAIPLSEIIFPYIRFSHPEFNRILTWMRGQVLTANELTESIQTKGVFTGVHATVGGLDFHFGTGGIHGSVSAQVVRADAEWTINDIDVAGLYPAIAIVNGLYPEHLGQRFVFEYSQLPIERAKHKKGTVQNAALKLAANGTYGNSNNQYSVFYDPKFTMAITINGQLLLCMLAEWLLSVPSLSIIQINTDGVTYRCRRDQLAKAREIQKAWEAYTRLVLEEVEYSRMWIRDVNNYVAESTSGKLKQKGAYWYPIKFPEDISTASPPAWHKDFSNVVSQMAAVEHMTNGTPIEQFILHHDNPFHFMLRAKVDRSSQLWIGDRQVQRITRYYVARQGGAMRKVSPPAGPLGTWKRKNGISDSEYYGVLQSLPAGQWDARIHTKNQSKYEIRETGIQAGFLVADCSRASDFDFNNVNYDYYVREAEKLVVR